MLGSSVSQAVILCLMKILSPLIKPDTKANCKTCLEQPSGQEMAKKYVVNAEMYTTILREAVFLVRIPGTYESMYVEKMQKSYASEKNLLVFLRQNTSS